MSFSGLWFTWEAHRSHGRIQCIFGTLRKHRLPFIICFLSHIFVIPFHLWKLIFILADVFCLQTGSWLVLWTRVCVCVSTFFYFPFFAHLFNINSNNHATILFMAEALWNVSKSTRTEEKERESRREIDANKEKDRYKEKYWGKSIQELDLSNCQRCTPSYRLLPEDVSLNCVRLFSTFCGYLII